MTSIKQLFGDMDTAEDWLCRVRSECSILILKLGNGDVELDMFDKIKALFNEKVPHFPITSEVKNWLATPSVTDPRIFFGRQDLRNVAISRFLTVIKIIRDHDWRKYDFNPDPSLTHLSPDAPESLPIA